jgi:hypothetical protein
MICIEFNPWRNEIRLDKPSIDVVADGVVDERVIFCFKKFFFLRQLHEGSNLPLSFQE